MTNRARFLRLQKIAMDCMEKAGIKTIPEKPVTLENRDKIPGDCYGGKLWAPDYAGLRRIAGESRKKMIY